jgi:Protein of unknown function (DUF2924)
MRSLQKRPSLPLSVRVEQLSKISREQLTELWIKHYRKPIPKAISTTLLLRAIAYAIQEQTLGGINKKEQRLLERLSCNRGRIPATSNPNLDMYDDGTPVMANSNPSFGDNLRPISKTRALPRAGTRIVRNWQGVSYTVDIVENGFKWNDKVYGSLTKIAFAITGAHWSGPRFFRL